MMSLLLEIAPADLGLPSKFTAYRTAQAEAIDFAMSSEKSFIAICAPTGVGKSLLGVTVQKALDERGAYLTATKGLQDQNLLDFSSAGMVDMRGRANYPCRPYTERFNSRTTCDAGNEQGCSLSDTDGCPYMAAYKEACSSQIICTNYSYWLHLKRASTSTALSEDGGRDIGLLICDEAHDCMDELARFMQVTIPLEENPSDPGTSGLMSESSGQKWKKWAFDRATSAALEMKGLKDKYGTIAEARKNDNYTYLENLAVRLKAIALMDDNWVWETDKEKTSFDPIWPGRYSHLLWGGVRHVLLLSATLRPYTLSLLGLSRDDYDFKEVSNGWPPNRAPVYYLPTVRLNWRSTDEDYQKVTNRIDEIISSRLDRKGIIHTVSYARMRNLLSKSKYSRFMFFNESSSDSPKIAKRFRESPPPAILISPSFGTGWDFSYDSCEYQIIPKVPFPYSESRVMKERNKDEQYRIYSAMLEVTQMVGRGRRAPDDRCETFILDNNFPLVFARGKTFAPRGFVVHRISTLPTRPEKISKLSKLSVAL